MQTLYATVSGRENQKHPNLEKPNHRNVTDCLQCIGRLFVIDQETSGRRHSMVVVGILPRATGKVFSAEEERERVPPVVACS